MTKNKITPPPLDSRTILRFFDVCDWACWTLKAHSGIEQAPEINRVMKGPDREFLWRLSSVTQEYAWLQLSKLHDPAIQMGRVNLSINYVIEYGDWDAETRQRLETLRDRLSQTLASSIKPARNMTLCHNDLEILLKNIPLGEWADPDTLNAYTTSLQEFVDIVFRAKLGEAALILGDDAERMARHFVSTLAAVLEK